MSNKDLAHDIFEIINRDGIVLPGTEIKIIEAVLDKKNCINCRFQSDTGEFKQCDECRRNPALRDFFEPKEATR